MKEKMACRASVKVKNTTSQTKQGKRKLSKAGAYRRTKYTDGEILDMNAVLK